MKFPRNARIFRGQLDAAPFVAVFFLLIMFVMLGSLVHTPGVRIKLPVSEGFPGPGGPTVAVAVDAAGRFYFRSRHVSERELTAELRAASSNAPAPLTLVVLADAAATSESWMELAAIAREAGIYELSLSALPPVIQPEGDDITVP